MWPPMRSSSSQTTGRQRKNSFMAYANVYSNQFHAAKIEEVTSPFKLATAIFNALLATALFRCWHILVFYLGWATMVVLINEKVTSLSFQATLLTVVGTVLGFVISYRTTSSFERYNEGRRFWSQIIMSSRILARAVWFHVPDLLPVQPIDEKEGRTEEERKARNLIEKKTVINLIEAFAIAVKHYLRGEEGIHYVDLYHLVKFLPSYAFPTGVIPSEFEQASNVQRTSSYRAAEIEKRSQDGRPSRASRFSEVSGGNEDQGPSIDIEPATPGVLDTDSSDPATLGDVPGSPHVSYGLPHPVTEKSKPSSRRHATRLSFNAGPASPRSGNFTFVSDKEAVLLPSSMPPKYSVFDIFPFSLFITCLWRRGRSVEGKKAARIRAKNVVVTRNVPLEISMYLTSYISALQQRKAIDVPTTNLLIQTVNQLTDALTGLERILTTPIPFSYSIHLWVVTIIYCLALPFQIYSTLKYVTIPATGIISFFFFGFLVAGEEIENPFGYDKNDLNMEHFCNNIIRNELRALTAFPPPAPDVWAFSPRNDRLFATGKMDLGASTENGLDTLGVAPSDWMQRGSNAMRDALARAM